VTNEILTNVFVKGVIVSKRAVFCPRVQVVAARETAISWIVGHVKVVQMGNVLFVKLKKAKLARLIRFAFQASAYMNRKDANHVRFSPMALVAQITI